MSRIDALNGRWYECDGSYYPSVTTALRVVAKGNGFERWLGQAESYEAAIAKRDAAGQRGTMVHDAIETLLTTGKFTPDSSWDRKAIKQLQGFANWHKEAQPEVLSVETFLVDHAYGYAGTCDLVCRIGDETWLIDVKTSADVYPTYHLQTAAYAHAYEGMGLGRVDKTGILLLKATTKKGWQLVPGPERDCFGTFCAALMMFRYLEGDQPILKAEKELLTEVTL